MPAQSLLYIGRPDAAYTVVPACGGECDGAGGVDDCVGNGTVSIFIRPQTYIPIRSRLRPSVASVPTGESREDCLLPIQHIAVCLGASGMSSLFRARNITTGSRAAYEVFRETRRADGSRQPHKAQHRGRGFALKGALGKRYSRLRRESSGDFPGGTDDKTIKGNCDETVLF